MMVFTMMELPYTCAVFHRDGTRLVLVVLDYNNNNTYFFNSSTRLFEGCTLLEDKDEDAGEEANAYALSCCLFI